MTYPTTLPLTRLANLALTREKKVATRMEMSRYSQHSRMMAGSMRMWLTDAISAVKVMMKVEVPTAVLRSYPSIAVKTISIIMPPPEPKNPVPNPMVRPKKRETAISLTVSLTLPSFSGRSLESGLTRKRIPIATQRNSEKPPSTV